MRRSQLTPIPTLSPRCLLSVHSRLPAEYGILDAGGGGACGPRCLWLADQILRGHPIRDAAAGGQWLRGAVCRRIEKLLAGEADAAFLVELIRNSMATWYRWRPDDADLLGPSKPVFDATAVPDSALVSLYRRAMNEPSGTTWADTAFVAIAADCLGRRVTVHLHQDDEQATFVATQTFDPFFGAPTAEIILRCVVDHHFVLQVRVATPLADVGQARNCPDEPNPAMPDVASGSDGESDEGTDVGDEEVNDVATQSSTGATSPPILDIRVATAAAVMLICVSVLAQPLIFAHVNGFSTIGVELPQRATRSRCLQIAQKWTDMASDSVHYAYMVGEYVGGARLLVAPLAFTPRFTGVVRTPARRARLLTTGAAFVWCTLAALAGTPLHDAAARTLVATSSFVRPLASLADSVELGSEAAVQFRFGAAPAVSLLRRPTLRSTSHSTAIAGLAQGEMWGDLLRDALVQNAWDPLLEGWLDRIRPVDVGAIPSDFMKRVPQFDDPRVGLAAFPPIYHPLSTPWLRRQPQQAKPPPGAPHCVRSPWEMLTLPARERLGAWLTHSSRDLSDLARASSQGPAAEPTRRRPPPMVLGQNDMLPWARGRIWDCRSACCKVQDFSEPMQTHLNLDYLRTRLKNYPDQYLVANLLEGARLDADVELQSVFIPHLLSIAKGFRSVAKEIRRLQQLGWYDFFDDIPFWPMYFNGQGSIARKLEPDRYRRTTDASAPYDPLLDSTGLAALSINTASHIFHMPQHFLADRRPEFLDWLQSRSLPFIGPVRPSRSKWHKEVKPSLEGVMATFAILRHAAALLGEPLYLFCDDAKDYFNQLAMAPSELHKLGIVFIRDDADLRHETPSGRTPPSLIFVSEKRLGFGTHGASNLAQRFSEALLAMFRADLDKAEAPHLRRGLSSEMDRWLQSRDEVPCEPPCERHEQRRLYSVHMYTDDPIFCVVGVQRALRALRIWRKLTDSVQLVMAIPEKRTLGVHVSWLGVIFIASLGLVVVPVAKLLRASRSIRQVLAEGVPFSEYRALCGLLEHLRAVNLARRNVMHGLYHPHGPLGASREGPCGTVMARTSPPHELLMRKQLQAWLLRLGQSSGVSALQALRREVLEPIQGLKVTLSADACLEDDFAGMGGFCHGFHWHFEIPSAHRKLFTIPTLEFLALLCSVFIFFDYLDPFLDQCCLTLLSDALTTALTLPAESEKSPALVASFQWAKQRPEFIRMSERAEVAHVFGDANPFSDRLSRGRMAEFRVLCAQVGLRPTELDFDGAAKGLYDHMVEYLSHPMFRAGGIVPEGLHPSAPSTSSRSITDISTIFAHRLLGATREPMTATTESEAETPAHLSILARRLLGSRESHAPAQQTMTALPTPPAAACEYGSRLHLAVPVAPQHQAARPIHLPPAHETFAHRLGQPLSLQPTSASSQPGAPTLTVKGIDVAFSIARQLPTWMPTPLQSAAQTYARQRTMLMGKLGEPDMRLSAAECIVLESVTAVGNWQELGTNANTNDKDERAWSFWVVVCAQLGTSPLRTAADAAAFPEKNAHLLATLMLYAVSVCVPKQKRGTVRKRFIKPRSALAYPLAIVRIFGRWGVTLPGYKMLKAALHGLMRSYVAVHGHLALAPHRAEPMRFEMVRTMHDVRADGTNRIGQYWWDDASHDVFMFRRINLFLILTAFRLAELTKHASGEVMYLTRACISFVIMGRVITHPSRHQLLAMVADRDGANIIPPRSKSDQFGEVHCPFPIFLTFRGTPYCAVQALMDIEFRFPCSSHRDNIPLFTQKNGQPYSHGMLDKMLHTVLEFCFGSAVALVFSWHSYRAGLATALAAANVDDAMIMLICRWVCNASLAVYRRLANFNNSSMLARASRADVSAVQSANLPRLNNDAGFAAINSFIGSNEYDEACQGHQRANVSGRTPPRSTPSRSRLEARTNANRAGVNVGRRPRRTYRAAHARPDPLVNRGPMPFGNEVLQFVKGGVPFRHRTPWAEDDFNAKGFRFEELSLEAAPRVVDSKHKGTTCSCNACSSKGCRKQATRIILDDNLQGFYFCQKCRPDAFTESCNCACSGCLRTPSPINRCLSRDSSPPRR